MKIISLSYRGSFNKLRLGFLVHHLLLLIAALFPLIWRPEGYEIHSAMSIVVLSLRVLTFSPYIFFFTVQGLPSTCPQPVLCGAQLQRSPRAAQLTSNHQQSPSTGAINHYPRLPGFKTHPQHFIRPSFNFSWLRFYAYPHDASHIWEWATRSVRRLRESFQKRPACGSRCAGSVDWMSECKVQGVHLACGK